MKKAILLAFVLPFCTILASCQVAESKEPVTTATTAASSEPQPAVRMAAVFAGESGYTLGTWWWNAETIKKEEDRTVRLDFLQENGVTEIYLYDGGNIFDKYVRVFIKDCHSRRIRVAALNGDAGWLAEDGYQSYQRWLAKVAGYQASSEENERFYGIHIDFEPGQDAGYAENPAAMSAEVGRIYDTGRSFCDENGLVFEADVSMWLDDPSLVMADGSDQVTLGEYIVRRVDTLSIMSYRDTAEAQFRDAGKMMRLAAKYSKKLILGSETGVSSEAAFVTYLEEGRAEMVAQQTALKSMISDIYDKYGLAIHHVESWMAMKD